MVSKRDEMAALDVHMQKIAQVIKRSAENNSEYDRQMNVFRNSLLKNMRKKHLALQVAIETETHQTRALRQQASDIAQTLSIAPPDQTVALQQQQAGIDAQLAILAEQDQIDSLDTATLWTMLQNTHPEFTKPVTKKEIQRIQRLSSIERLDRQIAESHQYEETFLNVYPEVAEEIARERHRLMQQRSALQVTVATSDAPPKKKRKTVPAASSQSNENTVLEQIVELNDRKAALEVAIASSETDNDKAQCEAQLQGVVHDLEVKSALIFQYGSESKGAIPDFIPAFGITPDLLCEATTWHNNCGVNCLVRHFYDELKGGKLTDEGLGASPEYQVILELFRSYYDLPEQPSWQAIGTLLERYTSPVDREAIFAPVLRWYLQHVLDQREQAEKTFINFSALLHTYVNNPSAHWPPEEYALYLNNRDAIEAFKHNGYTQEELSTWWYEHGNKQYAQAMGRLQNDLTISGVQLSWMTEKLQIALTIIMPEVPGSKHLAKVLHNRPHNAHSTLTLANLSEKHWQSKGQNQEAALAHNPYYKKYEYDTFGITIPHKKGQESPIIEAVRSHFKERARYAPGT